MIVFMRRGVKGVPNHQIPLLSSVVNKTWQGGNFMVTTKTQALDKQKAAHLVNSFLDECKHCCNQKQTPNISDFEELLSYDFHYSSNGKDVGKNIQDFMKRIEEVKEKYSHIESSPLHHCWISDDKVIIQYDMDLTSKEGKKLLLNTMAIATIDGDLITYWSQVSHEKGKDDLTIR